MAQRLTLSTVGIKSPLDVTQDTDEAPRPAPAASAVKASSSAPSPRPSTSVEQPATPVKPVRRTGSQRTRSGRAPRQRTARVERRGGGVEPFYGSGRPLQTSIALDEELADLLEQIGRAARVSVNSLVVAALQAGLPPHSDHAREAIVDERVRRAGQTPARVEHNLRLPEHLRARIDELVAAARERLPRAARADLINAALRTGLPEDAEYAAELVAEHARRLERDAALA